MTVKITPELEKFSGLLATEILLRQMVLKVGLTEVVRLLDSIAGESGGELKLFCAGLKEYPVVKPKK